MVEEKGEVEKSLKLLARSSFVVFVFVVLSKLLTYLYTIVIARKFGPNEYGLFSLGLMIFILASTFAALGLPDGLLRFIPLYKEKEPKKSKYLLGLTFKISLFLSFLVGVALFLLSDYISLYVFHDAELSIFLKIFGLLIPINVISSIFLSVIKSYERITTYSFIINFFQNALKLLAILVLIIIGLKTYAIMFSYALGVIGVAFVSFFASKKYLGFLNKAVELKDKKGSLRKEFFSYSWPMIFLGLISGFFYWTDAFVIGYFRASSDVGIYSAAFAIVTLFGIAPELFMRLFFPMIVREYSNNKIDVIKQISKQVGKWIFLLNVPVFIIVFLFPGAIINILFGETYLSGAGVLQILAVGGFISSLFTTPLSNLLSMKGKTKLILVNIVSISVFNFILNIILISKYGLVGVAISTTLSWILINIAMLFEVKHYLSFVPIKKRIIRIALVSLVPTAILLFLKTRVSGDLMGLILVSILFSLSYILLVFITKCLDENDWIVVEAFKKKFI